MDGKTGRTYDQYGEETSARPNRRSGSLAWLLDSSIPLPGGYRIGLDGLLGLIPGVGDLVGGGLSTWLFYQGYKQGVPPSVLARMLVNILIDTALGAIPILGDLFDFVWKSNLRNARLLEDYRRDPRATRRHAAWTSVLFFGGLALMALLLLYLLISLIALLWQAVI